MKRHENHSVPLKMQILPPASHSSGKQPAGTSNLHSHQKPSLLLTQAPSWKRCSAETYCKGSDSDVVSEAGGPLLWVLSKDEQTTLCGLDFAGSWLSGWVSPVASLALVLSGHPVPPFWLMSNSSFTLKGGGEDETSEISSRAFTKKPAFIHGPFKQWW